jgi:endonuclease YncB( thermonuclease family)
MQFASYANTKDWRDLAPLTGWCKIVKVVDGDTVWVAIDLANPQLHPAHNINPVSLVRVDVRLARVNAPELRGSSEDEKTRAKAAKQFVSELVMDKYLWFEFGNFGLTNGESLDPFHRQIGELYFSNCLQPKSESESSGRFIGGSHYGNLSDHLLRAGHAVPFIPKKYRAK